MGPCLGLRVRLVSWPVGVGVDAVAVHGIRAVCNSRHRKAATLGLYFVGSGGTFQFRFRVPASPA